MHLLNFRLVRCGTCPPMRLKGPATVQSEDFWLIRVSCAWDINCQEYLTWTSNVSGKNLHLLVSLGGSSAFVILMPKRSWPGAVAGVSAIFFSCRCWELADSRTKFYWVLDLVRPSLRLEHIRSLFFWVENVTGIGDWLLHDCIGILEWLYQSILNHFDEKLFSTHLGWIVAPYLFFTDLFWMHTSSTSATCRKKLRSHCSKLLAKIRSVNRQAFLSLIERRCMFLLGISADDVCQSWQGYTRIVVLSLEWMPFIIILIP